MKRKKKRKEKKKEQQPKKEKKIICISISKKFNWKEETQPIRRTLHPMNSHDSRNPMTTNPFGSLEHKDPLALKHKINPDINRHFLNQNKNPKKKKIHREINIKEIQME